MRDMDAATWAATDKPLFFAWGAFFTLVVDGALYPLELIKTRVQVEASSRATLWAASRRAAADVVARDGVRGLYRGFGLFTIGGLPSQGAYFWGYAQSRAALGEWNAARPPAAQAPLFVLDCAAGLAADVLSAPLWAPAEVLASRMQVQGPGVAAYANARAAARAVYAAEGARGFFRGLAASVAAFGPASALWWGVYAEARRALGARGAPEAAADAAAGFAAGVVSSVVTNPVEIAKTRIQVQGALVGAFAVDAPAAAAARARAEAAAAAAADAARDAAAAAAAAAQEARRRCPRPRARAAAAAAAARRAPPLTSSPRRRCARSPRRPAPPPRPRPCAPH